MFTIVPYCVLRCHRSLPTILAGECYYCMKPLATPPLILPLPPYSFFSLSFSPLPSPASVGSTASSCSGAGPASSSSQDPSPTLPRQMAVKVTEHLTLSGHMHQSLELWRQSEMLAEQCRGEQCSLTFCVLSVRITKVN